MKVRHAYPIGEAVETCQKKKVEDDLGVQSHSNGGKGEEVCRQILQELTGKQFPTVRPTWLKNPKTGASMELDCYNEELKIALEYNGVQHYRFNRKFYRDRAQFEAQKVRDVEKRKICRDRKIAFIVVPYGLVEKEIRGEVGELIRTLVERRMTRLDRKSCGDYPGGWKEFVLVSAALLRKDGGGGKWGKHFWWAVRGGEVFIPVVRKTCQKDDVVSFLAGLLVGADGMWGVEWVSWRVVRWEGVKESVVGRGRGRKKEIRREDIWRSSGGGGEALADGGLSDAARFEMCICLSTLGLGRREIVEDSVGGDLPKEENKHVGWGEGGCPTGSKSNNLLECARDDGNKSAGDGVEGSAPVEVCSKV